MDVYNMGKLVGDWLPVKASLYDECFSIIYLKFYFFYDNICYDALAKNNRISKQFILASPYQKMQVIVEQAGDLMLLLEVLVVEPEYIAISMQSLHPLIISEKKYTSS